MMNKSGSSYLMIYKKPVSQCCLLVQFLLNTFVINIALLNYLRASGAFVCQVNRCRQMILQCCYYH